MGISGVIAQFVAKHPTISKRQIELKIAEIAVKEKHEHDSTKVWHIRPEFQHLLNMDDFDDDEINANETAEATKAAQEKAKHAKPVQAREPFAIFATDNWNVFLSKSKTKSVNHVKAMLSHAWDGLGETIRNRYVKASEDERRNIVAAKEAATSRAVVAAAVPQSVAPSTSVTQPKV